MVESVQADTNRDLQAGGKQMNKKNWGGKRPGAGRPVNPNSQRQQALREAIKRMKQEQNK